MSESVNLVLDLPPKELSPNASQPRGLRGGKLAAIQRSQAAQRYRGQAWAVVHEAGFANRQWPHATAQVRVVWPDRRRRDPDNLIASLKAALDGIVAAGLIVGDHYPALRLLAPIIDGPDKELPRVVITITRCDPPAEEVHG